MTNVTLMLLMLFITLGIQKSEKSEGMERVKVFYMRKNMVFGL